MSVVDKDRDKRVAWLLNHTTLREFEVPLLRSFGLEVYTSKHLPTGIELPSGSVDYSGDRHLTLPPEALQALNAQNFYEHEFTPDVAGYLNRYFGTVIGSYFPVAIMELLRHFQGRILIRVFGREDPRSYSEFFDRFCGKELWDRIDRIRDRFWLAPCYETIAELERPLLQDRSVVLPVGMPQRAPADSRKWRGGQKRILFVCPRIASQPEYYGRIYRRFRKHIRGLPYVVAGDQPKPVDDPNVKGFVSKAEYADLFERSAAMFYHSREPRHLHYHPLEAIACGMPVIFMRGGLMDRFGGPDQPGACDTYRQARAKLRRALNGEAGFIRQVQAAQQAILAPFTWEHNRARWQRLFMEEVLRSPVRPGVEAAVPAEPKKARIAIILPVEYRGGSLRAAKHLAMMLQRGAELRGHALEVVLACLDGEYDFDVEFQPVRDAGVRVRRLRWKELTSEDTKAIERVCGSKIAREARDKNYLMPSDGHNDFLDCDFWLVVSDRLRLPLLPLRPYGAIIFDYIQRYVPQIFSDMLWVNQAEGYFRFVRRAKFVIVTTPPTAGDLNSYAGVPRRKIIRAPMYIDTHIKAGTGFPVRSDYLVWVANASPHKNHQRILLALQDYYEQYNGQLKTILAGPQTNVFRRRYDNPNFDCDHFQECRNIVAGSQSLRRELIVAGELSDGSYAGTIRHARFLLHGGLYDNGTFTVIDAALLGVPSLCSRYPSMEYLDRTLGLNLTFFDPYDVKGMARGLHEMEQRQGGISLPDPASLHRFDWRNVAGQFYDSVAPYIWKGCGNTCK